MVRSIAMATLGVICDDRALSMATLGVFCDADVAAAVAPISAGAGDYTIEMDERDVMDIVTIIIASGVLDDG